MSFCLCTTVETRSKCKADTSRETGRHTVHSAGDPFSTAVCLSGPSTTFHIFIVIQESDLQQTRYSTPTCMPPPQSFDSLHYRSSSTPHGRLPHYLFILDRKLCQFASQPLMEVQVFGHTAVQTNRLPFRQLSLFVMRWYALPVAGVGHPGVKRKSGFEHIYVILIILK